MQVVDSGSKNSADQHGKFLKFLLITGVKDGSAPSHPGLI
jgi:hypothetical protein